MFVRYLSILSKLVSSWDICGARGWVSRGAEGGDEILLKKTWLELLEFLNFDLGCAFGRFE